MSALCQVSFTFDRTRNQVKGAALHYSYSAFKSSSRRDSLWLPLAAAYGTVHVNARLHVQPDAVSEDLRLKQIAMVPQLFCMMGNGLLAGIVADIVDDLLPTGCTALSVFRIIAVVVCAITAYF